MSRRRRWPRLGATRRNRFGSYGSFGLRKSKSTPSTSKRLAPPASFAVQLAQLTWLTRQSYW